MFDVEMSIHKLGGYTKEDIIKMLLALNEDIDKMAHDYNFLHGDLAEQQGLFDAEELIQQKIDKLKEVKDDRG